MVDLILAASFGAVFYGGFKLGNRFKTLSEAAKAAVDRLNG